MRLQNHFKLHIAQKINIEELSYRYDHKSSWKNNCHDIKILRIPSGRFFSRAEAPIRGCAENKRRKSDFKGAEKLKRRTKMNPWAEARV